MPITPLPPLKHHWENLLAGQQVTAGSVHGILHDLSLYPDLLVEKIRVHQQRIIDILSLYAGSETPIEEPIDIDYMLLALCLLMVGKRDEAVRTCTDYYAFLGGTERISVVFQEILLYQQQVAPTADSSLISVVIPLYNQGRFLHESIPSVLNQTHSNIEIIIIDDGSTDDSLLTARALAEKNPRHRITVLTHPNKGKGFTRNRGVSESSGKYVCILDADDMLATTYLEEAVALLEANPDTGWITPVTLQFGHVHQIFYHFDFDMADLLTVCPSPVSSVFRRELWDEVGGFDQTMTDREDWEFWIKAAEAGWTSLHTDAPQFLYRIQEKRFGEREDINIQSKLEIIERHPWWFKPLTREELLPYCSEFSTCNLSPDILEAQRVARMVLTPKSRNLRKQIFAGIKQLWAAEGGQSASFQHLARHYALKGDRAKADQYRTAAEKARQAR